MKRNILQRIVVISIVTLVGLYLVIGPRSNENLRSYFTGGFQRTLTDNINLGLDLRGGSHLVMQVQVNDYLKELTVNTAAAAEKAARDAGFPVSNMSNPGGDQYRFTLELADVNRVGALRDELPNKVDLNNWTGSVSGNKLTWELSRNSQRALGEQAVVQAQRTIESRINALGVTEPTLQRHGSPTSYQLLLQMPGVQDPERVKEILGKASQLELVHVISPPSPAPAQTYDTEEAARASLGGNVPSNRRILPYAERDEPTLAGSQPEAQPARRYVVVEVPAIISGSELRSADAVSQSNRDDDYQIAFNLKPGGATKFGQWTGANVNQFMGVVLDGEVKSIAFIKSQISDRGEISGRFTRESAEGLALTLRSGALPASVRYKEERTVGPSLGADSIRSGIAASIAGLLLVVLFMVIYYKGSGINAVIALLLNLLLTVAALVVFDATLTLPGIAGLILTIGMAVDSNVLIFERIREELKTGKTVPSAVDQGFARAFVTIVDTHVTTIVSSLFLFVFGTGPIRGFAVTLILGLLINLFSAVYVSRTIFMWVLDRRLRQARKVESLSI